MRIQDVARLVCLAALWGGSFAFIRVAVPTLGPIWLAESRVALAFAALFAVALIRRDVPSLAAHWRAYLAIGTVNSALPFALFSYRRAIHLRVERRDLERDQPVFWRDRRRGVAT